MPKRTLSVAAQFEQPRRCHLRSWGHVAYGRSPEGTGISNPLSALNCSVDNEQWKTSLIKLESLQFTIVMQAIPVHAM